MKAVRRSGDMWRMALGAGLVMLALTACQDHVMEATPIAPCAAVGQQCDLGQGVWASASMRRAPRGARRPASCARSSTDRERRDESNEYGGGTRWDDQSSAARSTSGSSVRRSSRRTSPTTPADLVLSGASTPTAGRGSLSLPIWDEAVNTERETAHKVQRMADVEPDPLVREAIALQGFEEGRHAALLDRLTSTTGSPCNGARTSRRRRTRRGSSPAPSTASASTPSSPSACSPSRATPGSSRRRW